MSKAVKKWETPMTKEKQLYLLIEKGHGHSQERRKKSFGMLGSVFIKAVGSFLTLFRAPQLVRQVSPHESERVDSPSQRPSFYGM